MPDLTPEERAHLRDMATWRAEGDFERELGTLVLRLLDEADRLREGGDVLLNAVTFWARRHEQALRWARAWKAAAYDLRDQRDGARSEARFYEDGMHIADNEADALRARVDELERDNARMTAAWEKEQECASRAESQALDAEMRAADLRARVAELERQQAEDMAAAAHATQRWAEALLEGERLRARVAELEGRTGHDRCPYCPAREHEEGCPNHGRDTLRAFAARAVDLLDRKWRVCPECRCLIWEDEPAPGPHAPDCALAALLREGEGLALDALPARDSSSAQ